MKLVMIATAAALTLAGCSQSADESAKEDATVGVVILFNGSGQAKKSEVRKIGPRCWVAWYRGVEKVIVNGDGTAKDGPFRYRWTLDRAGPDDLAADRQWWAANCTEAPGP